MIDYLVAVLATFGISAVPGLELRAGIPVGMAMGLPSAVATAVAITGNVLQIPVAIWTVTVAYRYLSQIPAVHRWLIRVEVEAGRYTPLVRRWGWLGMAAFVLIPLPATGVWGGVVVARLIRLQAWALWLGLSLGLAISGCVFGLASHGAFSAWRFFF